MTVAGWSGIVSLDYVDKATLELISNLCTENLTVEQGMSKTMADLGYDPYFRAYLKHYPPQSGIQTISDLIKVTHPSLTGTKSPVEPPK